jgi:alpha-ketoglutarate-dependent taurine dioxygenase
LTAEDLFAGEDRREGSSLDEIYASQAVCELACRRRPGSDAETVWQNDVVAWCARQLQHNQAVHGQIANALMDKRRIRGKRLRDLCAKVEAA